jgi:Tol biopolymer transport system component
VVAGRDARRDPQARRAPAPTWRPTFSRNPAYTLTMTGVLPSFSPAGDRFVLTGRPPDPARPFGASIMVASSGTDKGDVIFKDDSRNVLAPQWSPRGDAIIFSIGAFDAFFHGFSVRFVKPDQRAEGGAQVALINPDGTGFREITSGSDNNAFPSMSPDGTRVVYRSFGQSGSSGLKIINLETNAVTNLTSGYDNFPLVAPRRFDHVHASRGGQLCDLDGETRCSGAKQLTSTRGNDAHQGWSPDGERIVFASSRMGFWMKRSIRTPRSRMARSS